ncbi:hypothetical protein QFC20_004396 [Naganishia adeliensis]|uniref:Uncharacterized protein n=1 Tax=Naganishia adeliensis TaxID=92952 RepID=A0ACC2W1C2_9TREE|nr:hypothetical protein QFC20_004396 [Naganishia adeliensis]
MEQELYNTLQSTLSPDATTRSAAEQNLERLMGAPEGGLGLCRIALNQQLDLSIRQSAAILLSQYIRKYWSGVFAQFIGPWPSEEIKKPFREALIAGLNDPSSKIRSAMALALSLVAHSDFPDNFPEFLPSLFSILQSGDPRATTGALDVLKEFLQQDLPEEQLMDFLKEIAPVLLSLLNSPQATPAVQAATISLFRESVNTLHYMKDEFSEVTERAIQDVIPVWLEHMRKSLTQVDIGQAFAENPEHAWQLLKVRYSIFKTLTRIAAAFGRCVADNVAEYIEIAIHHLHVLTPLYLRYYVSNADDQLEPPVDVEADDRHAIGLDQLMNALTDLLTSYTRLRHARDVVLVSDGNGKYNKCSALTETMIYDLLAVSQISRENEEEWSSDVNAFIQEEDDESYIYNVRSSVNDLLGSLLDKYPQPVARTFGEAVQRRLVEADQMRQSGNPNWSVRWKAFEAVLSCIGSVADELLESGEEDMTEVMQHINLDNMLSSVVPQLLSVSEFPFLQGRGFVFASSFVLILSEKGISAQYLEAAVQALESDAVDAVVKISAVKCIRNFCRYIDAQTLGNFSQRILSDLVPFLAQASENSLALVMETIRAVIGVDAKILNAEATSQLVNVIFQVWQAHPEGSPRSDTLCIQKLICFVQLDPIATAIMEEIFETVAGSENEATYHSLVQSSAPIFANILSAQPTQDNMGIQAEACELINHILDGRQGDVGSELGVAVWKPVFDCAMATEDQATVQSASDTLIKFIRKDANALLQWRDDQGRLGLDRMLQLLSQLLQPSSSESGALYIGDLILHLLRNAGEHLSAVLPALLKALVERLLTAKTTMFTQSLILPFAYLFTVARDMTLDLLEQLQVSSAAEPGVTKNALEVVIKAWCDEAVDTIQGTYSIKVNDMAMTQLLVSQRPSLQNIIVKGDLIIDESNRDSPHQYEQIKFPVRALKYLLNQLRNSEVADAENRLLHGDVEVASDDGDDGWDDDDPLGSGNDLRDMAFLSDLMGGGFGGFKDFEDDKSPNTDEDLADDPLMQMDMAQHITKVLQEAYVNNVNDIHSTIAGLSDIEKETMRARVVTL